MKKAPSNSVGTARDRLARNRIRRPSELRKALGLRGANTYKIHGLLAAAAR